MHRRVINRPFAPVDPSLLHEEREILNRYQAVLAEMERKRAHLDEQINKARSLAAAEHLDLPASRPAR